MAGVRSAEPAERHRPGFRPCLPPPDERPVTVSVLTIVLLFLAGFVSGSINAVAGGGTFVSFGALSLTGIPPIVANATSSIAQLPGYFTSVIAYRRDFAKIWRGALVLAVASVVGGILAPRYIYIEPSLAFTPMLSFLVVIMALLGGVGRLWGPIVGVIPFTFLWEAISASFPNQTTLLLGVSFLVIVYLLPRGFVGLIEGTRRRMQSREAFA